MSLTFPPLVEPSGPTGPHFNTDLPVAEKILFAGEPQRRTRLPGLSTSVFLHGLVLGGMAIWRTNVPPSSTAESLRARHSVRFIQLELAPIYRRPPLPDASAPAASLRDSTTTHDAVAPSDSSSPSDVAEQRAASAEEERPDQHRQFKLPANVQVQPVKQTLVEMDLPPTITFTEEIPLPTMLLWTKTATPPPMRRQFVAPPLRTEVPRVTQSLPAAPALSLPNQEVSPADLNMATVIPTEAPHLVHPTGVASPVTRTGQEPAKEIPQIGLAESAEAHAVNLISIPANPSRSSGMVVLPPANQIAASDAAVAGSPNGSGNGTGTSEEGTAAGGSRRPGGVSKAPGPASSSVASHAAAASAGSGAWSASGSLIGNTLPGTTRIELPKEGQYGVVVLGSANATPYPESVGALSGKMIYTVYLKVGFRKNWILQYCLPSAAKDQSSASGTSVSPVQAPWPFLIMRPDHPDPTDPDYIIVHGMVTDAGKFDQLALVFPSEFDKKELLMKSLKLWAFRPASRDGIRLPVEVLLIIPRETE